MEERERMLDSIMVMQEFNIKKDKQIEKLEQENQALKDRWEKLKDFVNKSVNNNWDNYLKYNSERDWYFTGIAKTIQDKIQELESENAED